MSMAGILLSAVVAVGALAIGIALQDWRPRPRRSDRTGRACPDCGDLRIRAVGPGNRLNGMLECRACRCVWSQNAAGG
ncbi:hypothetical protein ACFRCW_05440 [Streptomyces sp. NPDC056653]|uniref:hypothetical protein n=1 Tax=Streptomyces sp. NPDC056653 TaxID=3345894 RepID=UPI00367A8454